MLAMLVQDEVTCPQFNLVHDLHVHWKTARVEPSLTTWYIEDVLSVHTCVRTHYQWLNSFDEYREDK